jgi:hypothetical protein
MADGHFQDVELLRRELAALILEWAGKAVKDDPDGPMSTALTRAVSEAAKSAVVEQHQVLAADAADRIAEALDRRHKARGLLPAWSLALMAVAATALLGVGYLLGLQADRTENALPLEPAAASSAPIAPIAPSVEESATTTPKQPPARAQRAEPAPAKPASRPAPRELGRPAPANDEAASRSTQPVGATPTPAAPTGPTTP